MSEVFRSVPEDLPGLPPARPVEFQIDLIPGAAPVARAPYRLPHPNERNYQNIYKSFSVKGFLRPLFLTLGSPGLILFIEDRSEIRISPSLESQNKTFIRRIRTRAPILALPEGSEDFVVYCDASHKGLGKANVVADALSRKERIEPLRVRALVMTIGLDLPKRILEAQIEAQKPENIVNEDVGGCKGQASIKGHQDASKNRNTEWKWDIYNGFYHKLPEGSSIDKLARLYLNIIVARHGIPASIICDHDGRFTSNFWRSFSKKPLGSDISMALVSPETDARAKRTIQTLEDMLRACVIDLAKADRPDQAKGWKRKDRQKSYLIGSESRGVRSMEDGLCSRSHLGKGVGRFGKWGAEPELRSVFQSTSKSWKGCLLAGTTQELRKKELSVDDKLQFVEEPVEIMEREIKRLKRSRIPLVKVRWNSSRGPEFTWEREDSFITKYPQLSKYGLCHPTTRSEALRNKLF
ncbi:putative reverse transcriptase domain-containing protein [Tanacetum coccineum]